MVPQYLDLMDFQRGTAFARLAGIADSLIWQRPVPRQWSIGEILNHNYLLTASMYSAIRWMWRLNGWYGHLQRKRPYQTDIEDLYRSPKFPHWVGFLWTPRYNRRRPVSLKVLRS